MADRRIRFDRLDRIEAPLVPRAMHFLPIARRLAAKVDVFHVLCIRYRPPPDLERWHVDIVRPLFVVEYKPLVLALRA